MGNIKKIDVHMHTTLWEYNHAGSGASFVTADGVREIYKKMNIEKGFILPLSSPECRFVLHTNEEMEYIANKNPDIFHWFCNIDPRMIKNDKTADFSIYLEDLKKRGAIGIGEVTANMYIDDPLMENLFYHAGECDMPVTIHMAPKQFGDYGVIDELGLPRLEKILKKYPKTKILGHSHCFWSEISDNVTEENRRTCVTGKATGGRIVELMREYPNLYCDLSAGSGNNAMTRDPDFTYRFFEEFSDRLMYGTDICTADWYMPLGDWLDESFEKGFIKEDVYKKICRENAIKLFKLKL